MPDRWGWELPGGLVDEDEEPLEAATRDLEDQAGYRVGKLERLVSFELAPDAVDGEHVIFVGRAAEHLGDLIGTDGIARSEWVTLETVPAMIAAGEIWASATLIGLLHVMAQQR